MAAAMAFDFNSLNLESDPLEMVAVTALLPNGIVLQFDTLPTARLSELKSDIIKRSKKHPLSNLIKEAYHYEVQGISQFADLELYPNEMKRLCEMQPYFCLLKIAERSDPEIKSNNYEFYKLVSNMLGRSISADSVHRTPEIEDFREKISQQTEEVENERAKLSLLDRLFYHHPLRIARSPGIDNIIHQKGVHEGFFLIWACLSWNKITYTITVHMFNTARELIALAYQKLIGSQSFSTDLPEDYVFKAFGRDEFLHGDTPIIEFLYTQERLSDFKLPKFLLVCVNTFISQSEYLKDQTQSLAHPQSRETQRQPKLAPHIEHPKNIISWDIKDCFKLELNRIDNVNCGRSRDMRIGVKLCIYHGDQRLCAPQSLAVESKNERSFIFNKDITFDIALCSIPRMARLCIVVYECVKLTRNKKSTGEKPLAWVNITLFDYKDRLQFGYQTLYTWTYANEVQSEDTFHSLGQTDANPQTDECAQVQLTFYSFDADFIIYPTMDMVCSYAKEIEKKEENQSKNLAHKKPLFDILKTYMNTEKIGEMHDQDRNEIWQRRYEIKEHYPDELSVILRCVNWNERDKTAELWNLLSEWPALPVDRSLEFLDYAYPDKAVREFAIRCLSSISDEEFSLFLLQFVQAIKHESYIDCALVNFLLNRAYRNKRHGHFLFWIVRSDMQTPAMQIRFGLLLEAYLTACKWHVPELRKQQQLLDKLIQASESARKGSIEKARNSLRQFLNKTAVNGAFKDVQNPLNPSYRCKHIKAEQCSVMDSKMRPLWISFKNADSSGGDINLIFKNGDDLRQDMLTLQMLRLMDHLWKQNGMDLRMTVYDCISMGDRFGMIEKVAACTIANIQKKSYDRISATSAFKAQSLFNWLASNSTDIDKVVKQFTYSCAGYCVATYILGIGDRHSDNIMVKKNGQLFHIDFGHILGNFKLMGFGLIRRERVPFILTNHFVYVINKGGKKPLDRNSDEFCKFRQLCERAYLVIRRNRNMLIYLFSMMISTGLPELSSESDLTHLKEALAVGCTEEKALEQFRTKFNEALSNSWSTTLNWNFHNMSRNNKH